MKPQSINHLPLSATRHSNMLKWVGGPPLNLPFFRFNSPSFPKWPSRHGTGRFFPVQAARLVMLLPEDVLQTGRELPIGLKFSGSDMLKTERRCWNHYLPSPVSFKKITQSLHPAGLSGIFFLHFLALKSPSPPHGLGWFSWSRELIFTFVSQRLSS